MSPLLELHLDFSQLQTSTLATLTILPQIKMPGSVLPGSFLEVDLIINNDRRQCQPVSIEEDRSMLTPPGDVCMVNAGVIIQRQVY